TLMAGQQFDVSIQPLVGGRQNFVVTLDTLEADPANDAIFIPNPAPPTLKPAGFTLANARLGQAQTISWTRPSFPVASLFINPIVTTSDTGGGSFGPVNQKNPTLDPNATQATFTLPTTCNGQPVQSASFCVFYSAADGRTTTACWLWGFETDGGGGAAHGRGETGGGAWAGTSPTRSARPAGCGGRVVRHAFR